MALAEVAVRPAVQQAVTYILVAASPAVHLVHMLVSRHVLFVLLNATLAVVRLVFVHHAQITLLLLTQQVLAYVLPTQLFITVTALMDALLLL